MRAPFHFIFLSLFFIACLGGGSSSKDDSGNQQNTPGLDANDSLNEWLRNQYPDGFPADSTGEPIPSVDESGADYAPRAALQNGGVMASTVDTSDADSAVSSMCVAFGDPSNAWCIPTTNDDVVVTDTDGDGTDDSASLMFDLPPALCDGLSSICHDIRCYEFAQTEFGTFTASDVQYLAAACGQCDEPSCQQLLTDCSTETDCSTDADCASGQECINGACVGSGALRFSLTWSGEWDFDFYVQTPSGDVMGYSQSDQAEGGGVWDRDATASSPPYVENMYFTSPVSGSYQYWINLFSGTGGSFSIEVAEEGQVLDSQSGTLTSGESSRYTYSYGG